MSSQSTNLKLIKPVGGEHLSRSDYNDNLDTIDSALGSGFGLSNASSVNDEINALGDGLAIIANGNTHAAITSGWFVYVRQHSTLADGLYVATSNISANGTLSGSNLTADASGGLNALNSKVTVISAQNLTNLNNVTATGLYSYDKLSSAMTNAPSTGTYFSGTLRVTYYETNKIMQEFYSESGRVFTRHLWNGTWNSWQELALNANLSALSNNLNGNSFVSGNFAGGSTVTFSFETIAIVYVFRASSTANPVVAMVDGWAGITYSHKNDAFATISTSNKTVTITNQSSSYANYLIIKK